MSRYQIGNYAYGYDHPLQEYFLQRSRPRTKEIVGCLSEKQGTASNFIEAVNKLGIPIPPEHMERAEMDLPF